MWKEASIEQNGEKATPFFNVLLWLVLMILGTILCIHHLDVGFNFRFCFNIHLIALFNFPKAFVFARSRTYVYDPWCHRNSIVLGMLCIMKIILNTLTIALVLKKLNSQTLQNFETIIVLKYYEILRVKEETSLASEGRGAIGTQKAYFIAQLHLSKIHSSWGTRVSLKIVTSLLSLHGFLKSTQFCYKSCLRHRQTWKNKQAIRIKTKSNLLSICNLLLKEYYQGWCGITLPSVFRTPVGKIISKVTFFSQDSFTSFGEFENLRTFI